MSDTAQEIMRYIICYKAAHDGNSPTIREICDECGVSSTSVAAYNLEKLERAGKIVLAGGGARGIQVVGGRWVAPEGVEP